ncbi:hsp90 co-chaperone Cdc37 [Conoideocrella luteorostrata]|uniref:Hsp90 chaperone protein kinase-targeting subunit n=1 Tax=Conoideocrella luteorostrata TaxID=1105319 RepID=A0AAJ0CZ89_9HYPO|nr:hsp90 co-chaperone Cdc37 [Conoideocrella luteorostrata]
MVDYSKWDKLELSDDSDIEVHPNVDKRSFIRAKQNQIHAERQQRKLRVEALKYERVINETLAQRLVTLISSIKSRSAETRTRKPGDVVFQAAIELAACNVDDDNPPPQPDGVFNDSQRLPTYSKMVMGILDDVNQKLDERNIEQEQRYDALLTEFSIHLQTIQDLQKELNSKLDGLQEENAMKITSESYHTGFDSSLVNKATAREKSQGALKLQLLNPDYDFHSATDAMGSNAATGLSQDGGEDPCASPAAMAFANIQPSDYRASHAYISSHPDILQESETDGLLIAAFNLVLETGDGVGARKYVHQALLLQYCRMLGRDGVTIFFKRITTPGHQARELFDKDVTEKFQRIRELAEKQQAAQRSEGAEQIQIQAVEPDTAIRVQIPEANSGDEQIQKARAIFEAFSSEMKAALESGLIDKVNEVLGAMDVLEAENMVSLLGDAGCLNIEEGIIDTTTEEGERRLKDMQESATRSVEDI